MFVIKEDILEGWKAFLGLSSSPNFESNYSNNSRTHTNGQSNLEKEEDDLEAKRAVRSPSDMEMSAQEK